MECRHGYEHGWLQSRAPDHTGIYLFGDVMACSPGRVVRVRAVRKGGIDQSAPTGSAAHLPGTVAGQRGTFRAVGRMEHLASLRGDPACFPTDTSARTVDVASITVPGAAAFATGTAIAPCCTLLCPWLSVHMCTARRGKPRGWKRAGSCSHPGGFS